MGFRSEIYEFLGIYGFQFGKYDIVKDLFKRYIQRCIWRFRKMYLEIQEENIERMLFQKLKQEIIKE